MVAKPCLKVLGGREYRVGVSDGLGDDQAATDKRRKFSFDSTFFYQRSL